MGLNTGGGYLGVNLEKAPGSPMAGVNIYLFNQAGSYLGRWDSTGAAGEVSFAVTQGTYRLRADYLGYQFWSADVVVGETTDMVFSIPHQIVTATVGGVYRSNGEPLDGIETYLFNSAGAYQGLNVTTDEAGQVSFELPEKAYRLRADYLAQQFWSPDFTWQEAEVTVPLAEAAITVTGSGLPQPGVNVYAFTETGTYLNTMAATDLDGRVSFQLPAGDYKFRADYESSNYWSDSETLLADEEHSVDLCVGGGTFSLRVLQDAGVPLTGVTCYVFTEGGTYINMSETTDSDGRVSFDLASGSYRFRIDYLGTEFWSEVVEVPAVLELTRLIQHQDVVVGVQGVLDADARAMADIPVYLFSEGGSYLNRNATTDGNGEVVFNLPEIPCTARADYLGEQHWSGPFAWQDTGIVIHEGTADVHVSMAGQNVADVAVYVFSAQDSYLGLNGTTAVDGCVTFRLPAGSYRFRADYRNSHYWSSVGISQDVVNPVEINTGGGEFVLALDTGSGPLTDTRVFVFNQAGAYLGLNATSDASGQVSFALADGSYKFRVDYLGYQFWTAVYTVPETLSGVLSLPHQAVTITVESEYLGPAPLEGIRVYLFTPAGAYLDQNLLTDIYGQATFSLPDREYKVRADYLSQQYFSEVLRQQDRTVTIGHGRAEILVLRAGVAVEGAMVYLFTAGGAYLGRNETTDAQGLSAFTIPAGTYTFRIDEGDRQQWSAAEVVTCGQITAVEVNLDE